MLNKDVRENFISDISLEKSKVLLKPPILFLCGGEVDLKNPTLEAKSLRDALLNFLAKATPNLLSQIKIAEDFKDWLHHATYENLNDFEDDIAHVSSIVILILESAGTIAELGSFTARSLLSKKLLVFLSSKHYESDSFIKHGPIRQLEQYKNKQVFAYPWDHENPEKTSEKELEYIAQDIEAFTSKIDDSEKFSFENNGHRIFLIFELINMYRALMLSEIENYLNIFKFNIKRKDISRFLFLLEKFNFIIKVKRGNNDFYCCIHNEERIHFGGKVRKSDIKISSIQYYMQSDKESRRMSAINQAKLVIAEKRGAI